MTTCKCARSLTHSQSKKSCEPRKQTSLFSLTGSLFRASTRFRHLTRKRVPKCCFVFFFPPIKSYILNRLEGFDCSSRAATGTEVNVEAFFQHTVIVSGFPFVTQEPTARIMEQKSCSSCLLTVCFFQDLVLAKDIRNKKFPLFLPSLK